MRSALVAVVLSLVLAACGASTPNPVPANGVDAALPPDAATDAAVGKTAVALLTTFDLPRTRATRAISGTAYDDATGSLVAILDREPVLVRLTPSADYRTWTVGEPFAIEGRDAVGYDGEGIAKVGPSYFAVTNEVGPEVERLDANGKLLDKVALPAPYGSIRTGNKGIESLTASPSGRYLFFANEQALTVDGAGPTKQAGTRVRIDRRDLASGADEMYPYLTDTLGAGTGGDMGVSEMLAVSDDTLLVLERGFQSDYGNTVRLYRVSLVGPLPATTAALAADAPVLEKKLLVDLIDLDCACTHPSTQPNAILDNYEALALGPKLPDGRRIVFVTSDDNAKSTQVARILTLAVAGLP